jgi:hypothetical protein
VLLHPKGETFDVSMGVRGFFDTLTKIAAQPDKDFGEVVRQRRRQWGLPVAPAGKIRCKRGVYSAVEIRQFLTHELQRSLA